MRPSVCLVCVLMLALCVIVIRHPRAGRTSGNAAVMFPLPKPVIAVLPFKEVSAAKPAPVPDLAPTLPWESRFGELAGQPEPLQSQEELEELADAIPEKQWPTALNELASDSSNASVVVARHLLQRWTDKSPEAAAQWVEHLSDDAFGQAMHREVVSAWARQNLKSAVDWVGQQPDGGNKTVAGLALARAAAAQGEAVAAVRLLADIQPGAERDDVLVYSIRQWANQNRDDAAAWINQVTDETLRTRLLENVTVDWAITDPFDAAAFAVTALPPGDAQNDAIVNVVHFWATSAPDEAAKWVAQFPEGQLRTRALADLTDVWGKLAAHTSGQER